LRLNLKNYYPEYLSREAILHILFCSMGVTTWLDASEKVMGKGMGLRGRVPPGHTTRHVSLSRALTLTYKKQNKIKT